MEVRCCQPGAWHASWKLMGTQERSLNLSSSLAISCSSNEWSSPHSHLYQDPNARFPEAGLVLKVRTFPCRRTFLSEQDSSCLAPGFSVKTSWAALWNAALKTHLDSLWLHLPRVSVRACTHLHSCRLFFFPLFCRWFCLTQQLEALLTSGWACSLLNCLCWQIPQT